MIRYIVVNFISIIFLVPFLFIALFFGGLAGMELDDISFYLPISILMAIVNGVIFVISHYGKGKIHIPFEMNLKLCLIFIGIQIAMPLSIWFFIATL